MWEVDVHVHVARIELGQELMWMVQLLPNYQGLPCNLAHVGI